MKTGKRKSSAMVDMVAKLTGVTIDRADRDCSLQKAINGRTINATTEPDEQTCCYLIVTILSRIGSEQALHAHKAACITIATTSAMIEE